MTHAQLLVLHVQYVFNVFGVLTSVPVALVIKREEKNKKRAGYTHTGGRPKYTVYLVVFGPDTLKYIVYTMYFSVSEAELDTQCTCVLVIKYVFQIRIVHVGF